MSRAYSSWRVRDHQLACIWHDKPYYEGTRLQRWRRLGCGSPCYNNGLILNTCIRKESVKRIVHHGARSLCGHYGIVAWSQCLCGRPWRTWRIRRCDGTWPIVQKGYARPGRHMCKEEIRSWRVCDSHDIWWKALVQRLNLVIQDGGKEWQWWWRVNMTKKTDTWCRSIVFKHRVEWRDYSKRYARHQDKDRARRHGVMLLMQKMATRCARLEHIWDILWRRRIRKSPEHWREVLKMTEASRRMWSLPSYSRVMRNDLEYYRMVWILLDYSRRS